SLCRERCHAADQRRQQLQRPGSGATGGGHRRALAGAYALWNLCGAGYGRHAFRGSHAGVQTVYRLQGVRAGGTLDDPAVGCKPFLTSAVQQFFKENPMRLLLAMAVIGCSMPLSASVVDSDWYSDWRGEYRSEMRRAQRERRAALREAFRERHYARL